VRLLLRRRRRDARGGGVDWERRLMFSSDILSWVLIVLGIVCICALAGGTGA
jgi:hypothetical protein